VLAVGYGALLLARAGMLAGIEVAAGGDTPELLTSIEPLVKIASGRRTVISGKFFTAAGSAAGIDLGLAAVARLLGAKLALGLAEKLCYEWTNDTGAPERVLVEIVPPIK
jgi:transcriptional regulator GlxA family with amidase domain